MTEFTFNARGHKEALKIAAENGYNVIATLKKFNEKKIEKLLVDGDVLLEVSHGVADSKKRPYTVTNFPMKNKTKTERLFVIRAKKDNSEVGLAKDKKTALKLAKEYVTEMRESVTCRIEYRIVSNNDLVFNCDYSPSSKSVEGEYVVYTEE